ncbi:MAG: tRNA pseudouridine(55) synthase TruB [Gammaproteobacteria bacterium]|nr:tRNA pseudouridine(55) synthase TruB [Gammaproteobacteria bacterium]
MTKSRVKRRGRPVNGILLLDKPQGITSNGALQQVKRLYGAEKAGHTGSLDPIATGVLPICFGEATKFSRYLLEADKRYLATLQLGASTTTGDSEGEITWTRPVARRTREDVEFVLSKYIGEIEQIPSMFSAIKQNGQPLYKLARQGIEVERKARKIRIASLQLMEFDENVLVLDIDCSKGTYVRTLAQDIGEDLGCGAHVAALRRLRAGPFEIDDSLTMSEVTCFKEQAQAVMDQALLSVSAAVSDWPRSVLSELTASYLMQGQPVQVPNSPVSGWVSLFSEVEDDSNFIGVGEILDDGRIAPRRLVATQKE